PYWPVMMLQFFMGVVYFYGGLAKINPDWLQAMPLKMWMDYKKHYFLIGPLISQDWVAWLMAYGGLLLDLSVVFFLLFKRTRLWALGFVLFFHLTNTLIFQIGIFPWLSIALSLLFFEPNLPRQWVQGLRGRFKRVERWAERWQAKVAATEASNIEDLWQYQYTYRKWIQWCLALLVLFHTSYPLRHHFIPGNVTWTEEGHRFSWRMMLRSKRGAGSFKVVDPAREEQFKIRINDYLNSDQTRKMWTHPDMILQFAHFLEKKFREEGHEDIEVYADVRVSLNGRKHQKYIDPAVDLTAVQWSWFRHADWILPFEHAPLPDLSSK
ncbi:MAG: HTTM domain-containing protein, partial [Phaeodactylibacter sp.]|nr:HTTM domain-containing protein [Phaeodactylibacter sp.]